MRNLDEIRPRFPSRTTTSLWTAQLDFKSVIIHPACELYGLEDLKLAQGGLLEFLRSEMDEVQESDFVLMKDKLPWT